MSKGLQSLNSTSARRLKNLQKDKMHVIPFLSRKRIKIAGGQKVCLGEVRAAEDTKRTSRWPSRGRLVVMVPGKEPKDEAAGRQYAMKASVPAYSDLTAHHPPSSSSPASLCQPPEETAPRRSRS